MMTDLLKLVLDVAVIGGFVGLGFSARVIELFLWIGDFLSWGLVIGIRKRSGIVQSNILYKNESVLQKK